MNLRDYKPIIDALMDGKTVQFMWNGSSNFQNGWKDEETHVHSIANAVRQ